jgi:hypothetical protein
MNTLHVNKSTSLERLVIPSLSSEQKTKLGKFMFAFPPAGDEAPVSYDLLPFQTPVKNQNPRGACAAFAFIAAVEACYKRKYGQELDLSEEYFIHIVHSTQSTHNPSLKHENVPSDCSLYDKVVGMIPGDQLFPTLAVPEEKYAPYFGVMNDALFSYATYHRREDLFQVEVEAVLADRKPDGSYDVHRAPNNPDPKTNVDISQQAVDYYEYDTRHIPYEARKKACYGVTEVLLLSQDEFKQDNIIRVLEGFILAQHEVVIGFGSGPFPGHVMLLVGYDRSKQSFLCKNSWGNNTPYPWISYENVKNNASGGSIVSDVWDLNAGPIQEAIWIGAWHMEIPLLLQGGRLVLRRTRESGQGPGTVARLGSYYQGGAAHEVTGYIQPNTNRAHLYIDFDAQEGPPDPMGTAVVTKGQEFVFELSQPDNFDIAKGTTSKGGTQYSGLLRRILAIEGWIEVPGGGTTDVAVATAVFKGRLYLFGKGIQDRRVYVNSTADDFHWSGWGEVPGGGTTDVAVAAAVFKDTLYLFSKGIGDRHIYVNSSTDGSHWSGAKEVSGGGTTDVAASAVVFKDKLYLFSKGIGDKRIYVNSSTDGSHWSGAKEVSGGGTTDVAVAAAVFKDKLYLFSKGIGDRHIYVNSSTDGSHWSGAKEVPGGGTTDVAVGAGVWQGYGILYLMAKGIDDKGIYVHTTRDGNDWNHPTSLGGPTTASLAASSLGKNFYIFAKSPNHRICYSVFEWVG